MQRRANEHAGSHQDDHVGHARKPHKAVGDEGQNQKTAKHGKKEIYIQ
jgi:hypothetical protein